LSAHLGMNGERASEDDRDRLQGAWACVAVQGGGASGPGDLTWSFQGDEIVIRSGDQELRGTYRLSRMLVVHRFIDVTIPDPAGGAPVTLYGSYAFDNDRLSVCVNKNADLRPKTVRASAANGDVRYDF